jgi:putative endonuclease
MLRCRDDSYYIGSTSYADIQTRLDEHNDGKFIGSYTALRRPVTLVWAMHFDELTDAHEAERRVKGWSRAKKESLIAGDEQRLLSLSARRAGRKSKNEKAVPARELSFAAQSIGAKGKLEFKKRDVPSNRKPPAARPATHLIPHNPRHPEVRAERAPKDE